MLRPLLALLLLSSSLALSAQVDSTKLQHSEYGWSLSPHGTIRVLVLFCEIDYDKGGKDPQPDGADHWPKGQLPKWKDDLFDAFPSDHPKAMVTRYYHDVSLGDFVVLGDYVDHMFTLKQSEYPEVNSPHSVGSAAVKEANKLGGLHTAHGLHIEDFDLWQDNGKPGMPKLPGPDSPHRYDHVMVIARNSGLTHGQGSTDPGSPGPLYGYESDTQSRFGGMNALPFEILKHEFNHLLLGSNNFHSGGGNAAQFESYTMCIQGGWSLMGAASSSLLTCSGWDRVRMGWLPKDAPFTINARSAEGRAINGDLDPLKGDTGLFILRDFVTTGDAMRIRMPFLPSNEYRQWLWFEDHQTYARNGSPTDRSHWESTNNPCVATAVPGLYMEMQIEREDRVGTDIYGGDADYLHPLTACGHYDLEYLDDTLHNACPFGGDTRTFRRVRPDPFSGRCEEELCVYDRNNDGTLDRAEHFVPCVLNPLDGPTPMNPRFFGNPDHALTRSGNHVLGMGTNPSSANMLTLTTAGKRERYKGTAPDNRTIYLNGIRVELIDQRADGSLVVRVSTGATRLTEDVVWSADSIVLPPLRGADGRSLTMAARHRMLVDRSLTPTRMSLQEEVHGERYFAPPTRLTLLPGATAYFEPRSRLQLDNGTILHLMPGSSLTLDRTAKLVVDASSAIIVHGNATLLAKASVLKKLRKQGRLRTAAP